MYQPIELARFALSEFQRGLEGLTDEEARSRTKKADGTEMNAISWTIGHVSAHWLGVATYARGDQPSTGAFRFFGPAADPTPLSLDQARKVIAEAVESIRWLERADDALFATVREDHPGSQGGKESVGTALARVTLHTWFHTGEINAVRQMLGHPEIPFVGQLAGNLEWRAEPDNS